MPKFFKRLFSSFKIAFQFPELFPLQGYSEINLDECRDRYLNYMKTANFYCNLVGARYRNFLQPFVGGSKRNVSRFELASTAHIVRNMDQSKKNQLSTIQEFYEKLAEKLPENKMMIDLRNIFDNHEQEIYFDHMHNSDLGYQILGKKMAEVLLEMDK